MAHPGSFDPQFEVGRAEALGPHLLVAGGQLASEAVEGDHPCAARHLGELPFGAADEPLEILRGARWRAFAALVRIEEQLRERIEQIDAVERSPVQRQRVGGEEPAAARSEGLCKLARGVHEPRSLLDADEQPSRSRECPDDAELSGPRPDVEDPRSSSRGQPLRGELAHRDRRPVQRRRVAREPRHQRVEPRVGDMRAGSQGVRDVPGVRNLRSRGVKRHRLDRSDFRPQCPPARLRLLRSTRRKM